MNKELVSIIIPVYNGEENIGMALEAINNQTYTNYEVVVVDDGSSDNTKDIVMNHIENNKRIKYYYKNNSGVSDSRNYGITKSNGKYIAFLDCDDYYDYKWIEKMYNKIKQGFDLCYCGYKSFSGSNIKKIRTKFSKANVLKKYLLGVIKIQTGCFLISKKIILNNKLEFRANANWGEDVEFFCKVLKKCNRISFIREHLVYYNIEDTEKKLSKFNINKIEKNISMIKNIEREVFLSREEKSALINYLAPATIINFLYNNYNKIGKKEIENILHDNLEYIKNRKFVNGLRSIKINILYAKIKRDIKK